MEQDIIQSQKNIFKSYKEANNEYITEIRESEERIQTFYSAMEAQYHIFSKTVLDLWEKSRAILTEKSLSTSWVDYNTKAIPNPDVINDQSVNDLFLIKIPTAISLIENDINSLHNAIYLKYEHYKLSLKIKIWILVILGLIISTTFYIQISTTNSDTDTDTETPNEEVMASIKISGKNITGNEQPQKNKTLTENGFPYIRQLIQLATDNGGINNESVIMDTVYSINSQFPCPSQKYKKSARADNDEGIKLTAQEQFNQALGKFQLAYELDPTDIEIMNNLGNAYIKVGNFEKAEYFLTQALVYDPARALAWGNLGEVYAKKGNAQSAVAAFSNTLRFTRDTNQTRKFLNSLIVKADNPTIKQAAEQALQLPYITPTRPKFCYKEK